MTKRRVLPVIRDFPRQCRPSSTIIGLEPKLKYFGDNVVQTKNLETKRMISFKKRPSSYRDFISLSRLSIDKNKEKKRKNPLYTLLSQGDHVARKRVRAALRLFNTTCRNYAKKGVPIALQDAAKDLQVKGKFVNPGKQIIGSVPGVEVGDEFLYWREFNVVGLHRQITRGIDYLNVNGMLLATSVVSRGIYDDDVEDTNELVYMGEGGNVIKKERKPKDQKLKRGNLALKNSFEVKNPVRVILKSGSKDEGSNMYAYYGLYQVDKYWHEKGLNGKLVYKFKLKRMPDQAEVPWNELKKSQSLEGREGLCVNDISYGKELIPICAINTVDDEGPPMFEYMTRMVYPNLCNLIPYVGCDCVDGCCDSAKCSCVERNGGKIPFNGKKAVVVGRPNCIVYECGPSCKCPPTCQNRVSQHGIQFRFEIFKTKTKGWGVRSLNSIPSGSFVCEYTGELIEFEEAKNRANNDEYLFDIGNNYSDDTLWEELLAINPDIGLSSSSQVIEHGSFTIDASHRGNFGRFINHSCSPNLFAQNVLYDHDDKKIPHIMLFAADNIPRMQELTYNYNYKIDQVCGADGNIRKKNCYCGALECTSRMY